MSALPEVQDRDDVQRISAEQLEAAARVVQHWLARTTPGASVPTAEAEESAPD